jgi:hypothetical protein
VRSSKVIYICFLVFLDFCFETPVDGQLLIETSSVWMNIRVSSNGNTLVT